MGHARNEFQVAIIDHSVQEQSGSDLIAGMLTDVVSERTRFILLTEFPSTAQADNAIEDGFHACLEKPVSPSQLLNTIRLVIAERKERKCKDRKVPETLDLDEAPITSHKTLLSKRELEILSLIVKGLSNRDIADKLSLTLDTVKNHIRYILAKLSVTDRTEAAVKALRNGLL